MGSSPSAIEVPDGDHRGEKMSGQKVKATGAG
jgi:hypothetical protein